MSRSRKKTPIIKFGGRPDGKRASNRKFRRVRLERAGKGMSYKKHFPQYGVHDFIFYGGRRPAARGAARNRWEKDCIRK